MLPVRPAHAHCNAAVAVISRFPSSSPLYIFKAVAVALAIVSPIFGLLHKALVLHRGWVRRGCYVWAAKGFIYSGSRGPERRLWVTLRRV